MNPQQSSVVSSDTRLNRLDCELSYDKGGATNSHILPDFSHLVTTCFTGCTFAGVGTLRQSYIPQLTIELDRLSPGVEPGLYLYLTVSATLFSVRVISRVFSFHHIFYDGGTRTLSIRDSFCSGRASYIGLYVRYGTRDSHPTK